MKTSRTYLLVIGVLLSSSQSLWSQVPPYDVFPGAEPPYYRVRYAPSTDAGQLIFGVNFTLWIPPGVEPLRGIIVHQHGCGEGSCKSGLTGAYDLHWQALARKHRCGLLSPAYEQPQKEDCQMWCDPRNGSDRAFQQCLVDFAAMTGHPELSQVPWALWGHSGGGHWAGGMVMLHPDRVVAAWLRSGVPLLAPDPARPNIRAHELPELALRVPVMCNLGTKEGVTVKEEPFAGVWPATEKFFLEIRGRSGLIGVSVDPLTSHECGNQRYLAIPWLDACLESRLPDQPGRPLRAMPSDGAWFAEPTGFKAVQSSEYVGDPNTASWLPNQSIAKRWMEYVLDTQVGDTTPPPAPASVAISEHTLRWEAEADVESGISHFVIERDGVPIGTWQEKPANRFGRPLFQELQYSDTPPQPLIPMVYTIPSSERREGSQYQVRAVNTVGLQSQPTRAARP
ncbi:MAG: hypothetical protein ACK57G_15270 [Planctomycetota bacterium]|jgi:pimeloyl-ACP methyl ester carboxylesterase